MNTSAKREVEEAKMPACAKSVVEVAEVRRLKLFVGVKAYAVFASVPQESTPVVDAFTSQEVLFKLETTRLVVEASVAAKLVAVAFVVVSPPLNAMSVVVALLGKR